MASLPRGLSYVVVVLTRDLRLQAELAPALSQREPTVEVQVLSDVQALLQHLSAFTPDALVLDAHAEPPHRMDVVSVANAVRPHMAGAGPLVVLDSLPPCSPNARAALLAAGTHDVVPRSANQVSALCDVVQNAGRLARLRGTLAERERHYRDILEGLTDGVFVLQGGVFTFVNPAMATMLGQTPGALLREVRLTDCVAAGEREALAARLARLAVSDGAPQEFAITLPHADGKILCCEVRCHASLVDGVRAVVGIGRDVTAARLAEAELQQSRQRAAQVERLRALGEISAGVAHDFNNALGTILGRTALARDKLSRSEAVGDDLAVIEMAGHHAANTVRRIVDNARPCSTDDWQQLDLRAVVQDAADLVRTQVAPGVHLEVDATAIPMVYGNGHELREVLVNLLRNALDAVGASGHVTIGCHPHGDQAVVEVHDTGHGMSDEVRRRIFEPFFTTKNDANAPRRGSGLGLSISHWILRRHGAQVQVESTPGKGTTFRLQFESPHAMVSPGSLREGRKIASILVVDDDPSVASMMQDLLSDQGYAVSTAGNAGAALASLRQGPVDLVITDLDLPDLGGWQLARKVREVNPNAMVGLISGWPLGASTAELRARGISFVLAKPFSLNALVAELERN